MDDDEIFFIGDDPAWLTARQALALTAGRTGDEKAAGRALCEWLMAGLVFARCKRTQIEENGLLEQKDDAWFPASKLYPVDQSGAYIGATVADSWNWRFGSFTWFYEIGDALGFIRVTGAQFEESHLTEIISETTGANAPYADSAGISYPEANALLGVESGGTSPGPSKRPMKRTLAVKWFKANKRRYRGFAPSDADGVSHLTTDNPGYTVTREVVRAAKNEVWGHGRKAGRPRRISPHNHQS